MNTNASYRFVMVAMLGLLSACDRATELEPKKSAPAAIATPSSALAQQPNASSALAPAPPPERINQGAADTPSSSPTVNARIAEVNPHSTSVITRQEIRAQLMPQRYTTLAAEIGARINSLPLLEGATFVEGQRLIGLDCSLQQAQLQKSQAELVAAEKTLAANVALEKLNAVGKLELELAEAALERARADIGTSQALLGKCDIRAPFAGRIAEQKVREQQYVQAGQPLLDILDDRVLELEFIIPSHWLGWVKPGKFFEVEIDETGKRYPVRLLRLGARVDPVSQSVKAVATIAGRSPELVAGMSGRVLIGPPPTR